MVGTGGLEAPRDVVLGGRVGLDAPGKTVSEALEKAGEGTWPGLRGLGWGPPNPGSGQGYADMGRSWGVGGGQWEK